MAKVTKDLLLNATAFFAGADVSYPEMLAANVGVKIGNEIPSEIFEGWKFDDEEGAFVDTKDGLALQVIETELYVAVRFEGDSEISFFALDDIE